MQIVLDATPLLVQGGGIKSYVHSWINSLISLADRDARIGVFPLLRRLPALDHRTSPETSYSSWARIFLSNLLTQRAPAAMEFLCRGTDVFHASHLLRRLPQRMKLTATVYDMTCWLLPGFHTGANVRETKEYAERTLRRADGLIAISECTKRDCIELLGIPAERIEVIYPGVPDRYFNVSSSDARRARAACGLSHSSSYVLYLGCVEPRKNLRTLLDAWSVFTHKHGNDVELVVAGPNGWESQTLLDRLGTARGVRRLGYVPETHLPGLIRGAEAMIYPSLYEGFGLPAAQAMAAGVPVITSNSSCLPEITGGAALLVDPHSPAEIVSSLEEVLTTPSLRERLVCDGRRKAADYRWRRAAEQSLRFFRRFGGA